MIVNTSPYRATTKHPTFPGIAAHPPSLPPPPVPAADTTSATDQCAWHDLPVWRAEERTPLTDPDLSDAGSRWPNRRPGKRGHHFVARLEVVSLLRYNNAHRPGSRNRSPHSKTSQPPDALVGDAPCRLDPSRHR
jgi:hypothetical protein